MEAGFLASFQRGRLQFEILGESHLADKHLISVAASGDVAAIAMGRLYYRADLARILQMPLQNLTSMSEAELAVLAYTHLGNQCFQTLDGDFALFLSDRAKKTLFAYRDPMGGFPLFFTQSDGELHLSTSLRTLKQMRPAASLNIDYIAEYLTSPTPFEQEVPLEATIYTNIVRVLAGHLLTVQLEDLALRQVNLCNWLRQDMRRGPPAFTEIVEQYRHLLTAAVQERMRGRIGTHYSGGMDSTSVGLIADKALKGSTEPLRTYTLTYDNLPGQRQEAGYIEAARNAAPNAIHRSLPGDQWYDFEDFDNDIFQDEPCGTVWQSTMSMRTMKQAAEDGVQTLLTGLGGEEFIARSPYYIADLLRRGQLATAMSESRRLAGMYDRSRWHYLFDGASTLVAPWLLRLKMAYGRLDRDVPWPQQTELTLAPWIRREFAIKYQLIQKAYRNQIQMMSGGATPTLSLLEFALRYRPGETLRWTAGTSLGVFTAHPFKDVQLIRFCLSIFEQLPAILDRQKPLLGDAMAGILPDSIRLRQDKGHFNEAMFRGLARNVGMIEKVIKTSGIDELGIFDCEKLLECLRQSAAGVEPRGSKSLRLSLYLAKWFALNNVAGTRKLERRLVYNVMIGDAVA